MPRKVSLMSAGFSAGQADAAVGTVQVGALAGSTQTDATAMTTSNVISTSGSGGMRLPASPSPGDRIHYVNVSGNTASIYPATGGTINALSANAAISIATAKSCIFLAQTGTQWRTIPLVPS